MFDQDFFDNLEQELIDLPKEVGTEAVAQIKNSAKHSAKQNSTNNSSGVSNNSNQQNPQDDQQQQQYLKDLYGVSSMDEKELELKKRQDNVKKKSNYQRIQQEIQEFRAKKAQEKTAYEKSWQKGTKAANTREEEMELWQKEQKKQEEKKKKEESITMPGSQQSKSGEQGVVMG